MYFANPWGLLGLLALPAIVAIHLFHQRFPPLLVGGAHLWGVETRITTAGRRPDRVPVTLSLILELLAALLLTIALSEPRFGDADEVVHVIAVLDDSASMLAHADNQPSARDLAIAELQRRSDESGRNARFTLIRSGVHPALLGRRAMEWSEAETVLQAWQPRATRHEFDSAWDEAAQVAGETGRFAFLTDTVPADLERLPQQLELVALGKPAGNVAISAARWALEPGSVQGQLFFRITNDSDTRAEVTVVGRTPAAEAFRQTLAIDPNDDVPLELDVPGGLGQLTVEITSPADGLETDNQVVLIEPAVRTVTIAVTLPADAEAADLVRRVLTALPDLQPGPAAEAHVVVGPAAELPDSRRDLWWLGVGPLKTDESALASAVTLAGPYILDKQHPLLEGVTLDGVLWAGAQTCELAVTPLVSCNRLPLLGQLSGTEARAYLLNIDLPASNLARTPDWPILLANLIELRRAALPGLQRWNYHSNEVVRLLAPPPDGDADTLELATPSGRLRPLVRDRLGNVEIVDLDEIGAYEIRQSGAAPQRFAVNFFDPEESDVTGLSSGRRTPPLRYEPTRLRIDDPYSWLIVLAALMVLASILGNWYITRPRSAEAVARVR